LAVCCADQAGFALCRSRGYLLGRHSGCCPHPIRNLNVTMFRLCAQAYPRSYMFACTTCSAEWGCVLKRWNDPSPCRPAPDGRTIDMRGSNGPRQTDAVLNRCPKYTQSLTYARSIEGQNIFNTLSGNGRPPESAVMGLQRLTHRAGASKLPIIAKSPHFYNNE
jgi:hypothetical protein